MTNAIWEETKCKNVNDIIGVIFMQIKNFNLNDETVFEIGKFAILWNLFEKNFCKNICFPQKLLELNTEVRIDDKNIKNLSDCINERRRWFLQSEYTYADESLHPEESRRSNEKYIKIMESYIKYEGDQLNAGCLLVIYRLRNNLMHGLKIAEELDNQIELFRAANNILETIERI